MKYARRKSEQMLRCCGEIRDDDGVDPRQMFRATNRRSKNDRKQRQLCKQVAETLDLVLAGEFDDDILIHLRVIAVDPAPDGSQLAVRLSLDPPDGAFDARQALTRLRQVTGRLRCEVASAITRKRAPNLLFYVVDRQGKSEGDR